MKKHCDFFTVEPESSSEKHQQQESTRELKVRLDKWLWAARFFKTRTLARVAIEHGKVFYNGELVSPSTEIQLNAKISIRLGRFSKDIIITGLSTRRKNSNDSLELFEELPIPDNNQEFSNNSNHVNEYPPRKAKKVVRFLRRSFGRNVNTVE
jgi:ribosome-associated heat shock protein Hsp15